MRESAELDTLDLKIIQGLQVGPRLPFARIAEVIGVSEQTVARRYRRLRGDGIMRVVAMVNPRRLGQSDWFVRVGCRPGSATRLAVSALGFAAIFDFATCMEACAQIVTTCRLRGALRGPAP